MSPLSSLSLVSQCKERCFLQKHSPWCFHTFREYLQNLQLHWSCLLSFYANSRCSEVKLWLYFCSVPERKVRWSIRISVCSWDLNILEFPILMLLDSRQRLSNNLSDHFIDQILKMFIYLTLGRGKSHKRNKILQVYRNGQFLGTNLARSVSAISKNSPGNRETKPEPAHWRYQ